MCSRCPLLAIYFSSRHEPFSLIYLLLLLLIFFHRKKGQRVSSRRQRWEDSIKSNGNSRKIINIGSCNNIVNRKFNKRLDNKERLLRGKILPIRDTNGLDNIDGRIRIVNIYKKNLEVKQNVFTFLQHKSLEYVVIL